MKKNNFNPNDNFQNLLSLMTAYQQSRVLFTLIELKIPKLLSNRALTSKEIAQKKKIEPIAMERFLSAAVSIGLLKKIDNSFSNSEITQEFLVKGKEFYLGGQIERQRKRSFSVWNNLTKHLKNWKYGGEKSLPQTDDQGYEAMAEQHKLALLQGFALAKAFNFSKYKRILDLGGGTGATSIALCKTYPHLESIVYDLPENTMIAQKFIEENELSKRIKVFNGDFKKDALPENFDAVLLANFMSVADAEENQKLLTKLYQKLPKGGVCILSGWIIDNSGLAPKISVLFCLEDICWNAPDVERSEQVYTNWLEKAGFENINCETYFEPTKMLYGLKNKD
ncbi:MAG: methyltransferase [Pyrinomonadaceae bacterium]|nr:methyltransferase [Pyrinomonadaceae bacterium]